MNLLLLATVLISQVELSEIGESQESGPLITVIDERSGLPAPGAVVHVFRGDLWRSPEEKVLHVLLEESNPALTSHVELVANAQGELHLSQHASRRMLWAERKDSWGALRVPPNSKGALSLVLRTTSSLRVRVVDSRGETVAGVPALLQRETGAGPVHALMSTSGVDGVVDFRLAGAASEILAEGGRWQVVLAFPHRPTIGMSIDPAAPPKQPPSLVMPETGFIEVEVLDASAALYQQSGTVWLARANDDLIPYLAGAAFKRWKGAPLRFRVGLGLNLRVHFETEQVVCEESRLLGPTRPSQVVRHSIRGAPEAVVLSGRAIVASGETLRDGEILAHLRWIVRGSGGAVTRARSLDTVGLIGQDGVFHLAWHDVPEHSAGYTLFVVIRERMGGLEVITDPLKPGQNRIGDITFRVLPTLASGRAVDPDGNPLAGVIVSLEGSDSLDDDPLAEDRTIASGGFELRGLSQSESVTVVARKEGYFESIPLEAELGARDLVLQLRELRRVVGAVKLPSGADLKLLGIRTNPGPWGWFGSDGTFLIETEPGPANLELYSSALYRPIHTISDVVGREVRRQDKIEIDLREHLKRVVVSVTAPDGEAVSFGQVTVTDVDGNVELGDPILFFGGRIDMLLDTMNVGLRIEAAKYKAMSVAPVREQMEVVLAK